MVHSVNSERRLLYIIDRLMKEELGNDTLAMEIYGESNDRTRTNIRNSLKVIKEHFGDKLVETRRGHHKLVTLPRELYDLYRIAPSDLMDIFHFVALFDEVKLKVLAQKEPELIAKIKREVGKLYHAFDAPFEKVENMEHWEKVKKAVKQRRYLSIAYEKNKLKTYNFIKPIRIVFARNNWYVAALLTEEKEEYDFTFFRLNYIKFIKTETKTFHSDTQAIQHLKSMQSLFDSYGAAPYDVTVTIDKAVSAYFRQKNYLKSQKIIQEHKDGSISVSYRITSPMEILPIIKQWIPYIHIQEPESLKREMSQILRDYLY